MLYNLASAGTTQVLVGGSRVSAYTEENGKFR